MKTPLTEQFNKLIKSDVFWLLLIAMTVRNVIQIPFAHYLSYTADAPSYCLAAKKIAMGLVDAYRTPFYPIVLNFCKLITPQSIFETTVFVQQIVSFLSILPFYLLCKQTFHYKPLAFVAALVYAGQPFLLRMNHEIFAESMYVSLSVFFMYSFSKFMLAPSLKRWYFLHLFVFMLVMIKPIGVVFYGAFYVVAVWLQGLRKSHQTRIIPFRPFLLGFALSFSLLLGFCSLNKLQNNFFGISTVTHDNLFANVVISDAYQTIPDERLVSIIDTIKYMKHYYVIYHLNNDHEKFQQSFDAFPAQYPLSENMLQVKRIPENPYGYNRMNLTKPILKATMTKEYLNYMLFDFTLFSKSRYFDVPVTWIYLIFLMELLIVFIGVFHKPSRNWVRLFVTMLAIAFFLASFWGGIGDGTRQRVLTPILPLLVYMLFDELDWLMQHLVKVRRRLLAIKKTV